MVDFELSREDAAEMAAKVAEGLDVMEYLPKEADRSRIEVGDQICDVLIRGHKLKLPELEAEDLPVWRAFHELSRRIGFQAIAPFAIEAVQTRKGLSRVLNNQLVSHDEMRDLKRFFMKLAFSLGL
jgi:hypothetical protein